jgi:hypothetical protein
MTYRDAFFLCAGALAADLLLRWQGYRRQRKAAREPSQWLVERMGRMN